MKALKIVGIVIGSLVALVILALALAPMFIPFKSMATEGIAEATGRKVSIDSLEVSVWGGLEVRMSGLVIEDKPAYGQRPLLKMKSLSLDAALLPLLLSHVAIEKFQLDGLEASLVRGKDGRLNWADMPEPAAEKKPEEPKRQVTVEAGAGDQTPFVLGLAEITGSAIFLKNQADGRESTIPLETFRLSTAAPGGAMTAKLDLALPGLILAAQGNTKGGADLDKLEDSRFKFDLDLAKLAQGLAPLFPELKAAGSLSLTATAAGPPSALAVKVDGRAADLLVSTKAMAGRDFRLADAALTVDLVHDGGQDLTTVKTARLVSQAAGLEYDFSGVVGTGKSLGRTDARYSQKTSDLGRLAAVISPLLDRPVTAAGSGMKEVAIKGAGADSVRLSGAGLAEGVVVEGPMLAEPFREPRLTAEYDMTLSFKGDDLNLVVERMDLDGSMAKMGITGTLAVKGEDATVRLKADAAYLDLDKLPRFKEEPASQPGAGAKEPTGAEAKAAPAQAAGQAAKPPAGGDRAAEVRENLKHVDIEVELNAERLVASGYEIGDLKLMAEVKDQAVRLSRLACRFLEGRVDLTAGVDFKPQEPTHQLKASVAKLRLDDATFHKLQKDMPAFSLPLSSLEGVFDFQARMTALGLDEQAVLKSLKGDGKLTAADGVTIGLAFLDKVPGGNVLWQQALPDIPRRFAKMDTTFQVADALAHYDMNLLSGNGDVGMRIKGDTNLVDQRIDAKLMINGKYLGRTFKEMLSPDGTLPVGLGGTLSDPQATIDFSALGAAVGKQLLQDSLKDGGKGLEEGLKGLLGR